MKRWLKVLGFILFTLALCGGVSTLIIAVGMGIGLLLDVYALHYSGLMMFCLGLMSMPIAICIAVLLLKVVDNWPSQQTAL